MGCKNTDDHLETKRNQKLQIHFSANKEIDIHKNQGKSPPSPDLEPPIVFTSLLHKFSQ